MSHRVANEVGVVVEEPGVVREARGFQKSAGGRCGLLLRRSQWLLMSRGLLQRNRGLLMSLGFSKTDIASN